MKYFTCDVTRMLTKNVIWFVQIFHYVHDEVYPQEICIKTDSRTGTKEKQEQNKNEYDETIDREIKSSR